MNCDLDDISMIILVKFGSILHMLPFVKAMRTLDIYLLTVSYLMLMLVGDLFFGS